MWPDERRIAEAYANYAASHSSELLGIVQGGQLVGLAGIEQESPGVSVLKHLAIKRDFRRQGMGQAMIEELMKTRQIGCLKAETDHEAVGFYERIGFQVTSLGEKYPGVERFMCVRYAKQ